MLGGGAAPSQSKDLDASGEVEIKSCFSRFSQPNKRKFPSEIMFTAGGSEVKPLWRSGGFWSDPEPGNGQSWSLNPHLGGGKAMLEQLYREADR